MAFITTNFFSKCLMRTVTVNAIIPVDKMTVFAEKDNNIQERRFKTLYLLHGIFGNHTDWVNGTRIQRWAEEHNIAVIMPSGENKFYVDAPNGEKYGEFIGKELIKVTRKLFPLSTRYEDTFISGLSMGGYGALINGLKYNTTFSHIAALSAGLVLGRIDEASDTAPFFTHTKKYYESVFGELDTIKGSEKDYHTLVLDLLKNNEKVPSIYMACGTEDFLLKENRDYKDFLVEQNIEVTYKEGPGGHDWDFWDRYILDVLEWLPLEETSKGINSGNVK